MKPRYLLPAPLARTRAAAVALLLSGLGAGPVAAGVIAPGESATVSESDFVEPRGVLVAESFVPFTLRYRTADGQSEFIGFGGSVGALLIQSVLRNPTDDTLTFLYNVHLDSDTPGAGFDGAAKGSRLTVEDFAGYSTDATGTLESASVATLSRSAGGSAISFGTTGPDANASGGLPFLVIKTDMTDFDATGTVRFFAADAFGVADGPGGAIAVASAESSVSGAFRPVDRPRAVPLPPAAYTAAGAIAGCVLVLLVRKRFGMTS